MRVSIWYGALVGIIISAAVLIVSSLIVGPLLSGIIVEILGAFLGVFAAVVVGEILKLRQDSQLAESIIEDLIAELKTILRAAERDPNNLGGYEISYWDASVAGGELRVLDRRVRRRLVTAYNSILVHNHAADMFSNSLSQSGITKDQKEDYIQRIAHSYNKMLTTIAFMLSRIEEKRTKTHKEEVQKQTR